MKVIKTKNRTLQSGRVAPQYNKEINLTISSMCPDKWLFVDTETGDVWHKREGVFDNKTFKLWRHANEAELAELRKLKY